MERNSHVNEEIYPPNSISFPVSNEPCIRMSPPAFRFGCTPLRHTRVAYTPCAALRELSTSFTIASERVSHSRSRMPRANGHPATNDNDLPPTYVPTSKARSTIQAKHDPWCQTHSLSPPYGRARFFIKNATDELLHQRLPIFRLRSHP